MRFDPPSRAMVDFWAMVEDEFSWPFDIRIVPDNMVEINGEPIVNSDQLLVLKYAVAALKEMIDGEAKP